MISGGFRQSMSWMHTWVGPVTGWLLFAIFLTGTLTVFDSEIGYWMQPELHAHKVSHSPSAPSALLQQADQLLRQRAGGANYWSIGLPGPRGPAMRVSWESPDGVDSRYYLKPETATLFKARETEGGGHFEDFHAQLHAGDTGMWFVSLLTVALLAILISGIVIHKRIFKDFFTFRPGKGQRSWLDAHNFTGILVLPFHLMIAYTGLVIEQDELMPAPIQALYQDGGRDAYYDELNQRSQLHLSGEPAPLAPLLPMVREAERHWGTGTVRSIQVRNPGDANARVELYRRDPQRLVDTSDRMTFDGVSGEPTESFSVTRPAYVLQSSMEGLHYAEFGGSALRWLYFVCGSAGAAMMATGLLLFTSKRSKQTRRATPGAVRFYALVEKLNVASIAGIMVASIAYFWGNRLLPAELAHRGSWEITVFFLVWLLCIPHALLRPARNGWVEQLGLAAMLCLLLPVLNGLTSDSHLLHTLPARNWLLAGVDLTALAVGALIAGTVWKITAKSRCAIATGRAAKREVIA